MILGGDDTRIVFNKRDAAEFERVFKYCESTGNHPLAMALEPVETLGPGFSKY